MSSRSRSLSPQVIILVLLLLLTIGGALPHYRRGQVSGARLPSLPQTPILQEIRQKGLDLDGWQTTESAIVEFSDRRWSQQVLEPMTLNLSLNPPSQSDSAAPLSSVLLLLLPQKHLEDRPQVEWTDLQGVQQWQEDRRQSVQLGADRSPETDPAGPTVTARWLRAWRKTEEGSVATFGVLQWYAWDRGGHWSPNVWFWRDWLRQWRGERVPWVAVAIVVPLEPLGDPATVWPQVEPLGLQVQQAIEAKL